MARAAPRLSICIPTHNGRAAVLEAAIDSVRGQVNHEDAELLEICVSDNASTDGTAELIDRLRADSEVPIRYRRHESDLGPAINTLAAVELARGDYCWILSSDDLLAEGSIARVVDLLDEHDGIVGLTVDQVVFNPVDGLDVPDTWFDNKPARAETCVLTGRQLILEELGLLFSGISLHIIDRRSWSRLAAEHREEALGGHGLFAHAVILALMARESPRWLWCPEPLVRYRLVSGNAALGASEIITWIPRFLDDFSRALRPHLDEPAYRRLAYRYAARVCHPAALLAVRRQPGFGLREDLLLARVLLRRLRWLDGFWSEIMPAVLMPRFASGLLSAGARVARSAMRAYINMAGGSPLKARLIARPPGRAVADTFESLPVTIENHGLPLRTWWPWLPLYVSCRWGRQGLAVENRAVVPAARINHVVRRGQCRDVVLRIPIPPEPGPYELQIGLTWGGMWLEEPASSTRIEVERPPGRPVS